jgi:hypothetical protein
MDWIHLAQVVGSYKHGNKFRVPLNVEKLVNS